MGTNTLHRASATLFGLALGAKTEFMNVAEILQTFLPHDPQESLDNPSLVTDDIQMAKVKIKPLVTGCES